MEYIGCDDGDQKDDIHVLGEIAGDETAQEKDEERIEVLRAEVGQQLSDGDESNNIEDVFVIEDCLEALLNFLCDFH